MTTTPPALEAGATLYGVTLTHWGAIEVQTAEVVKVTPKRLQVRTSPGERAWHLDRLGGSGPNAPVGRTRYGPTLYLSRDAAFAAFIAHNERLIAEVPEKIEALRRRAAKLAAEAERARRMAESGADEDPDLERLTDERIAAIRRDSEQIEAELEATS